MTNKTAKDILIKLLFIVVPILVWCFLFRTFLLGSDKISLDSFAVYGMYKFYFNSIIDGTFPLWEPFTFLGRPFYALASFNFFSPMSYIMALGLLLSGGNYYASFIIMFLTYLLVGHIGFYFLSKSLLKDRFLAYLGALVMLFSGVSAVVFVQLNMLLMYVPCVWFFYFLIEFSQKPHKKFFYGMCFCWMILITSYLPFYFITLFIPFIIFYCLLYWKTLPELLRKYFAFVRNHWPTVLLGIISMAIAFTPGYLYKIMHAPEDIVNPARHCAFLPKNECYDISMKTGGDMTALEAAQSGNLAERVAIHDLFAHTDKISQISDDLFFLPIMVYLLIIIGAFQRIQRPVVLLALLFTLITLIAMGVATPVHKILHGIVPYFKYFRNLFFFMVYLMPILTLTALFNLKTLLTLKQPTSQKTKNLHVAGILLLHLAFAVFLATQQFISPISWATIALSCAFWIFIILPTKNIRKTSLYVCLTVLILGHPLTALAKYAQHKIHRYNIPNRHVPITFNFGRPIDYQTVPENMNFSASIFYHYASMTDMVGYILIPESINRWTFYLSHKLGEIPLVFYTANKFYFYDKVISYKEDQENTELLKSIFQDFENTALISGEDALINKKLEKHNPFPKVQAIIKNIPIFNVTRFTANNIEIQTSFPQSKFFVYTDNFNQHWKAYINGKKEPLYRANLAFKGLLIPEGRHQITLRYEPPGGTWIYVFLLVYFLLFFLKTIHSFLQKNIT